MRYVLNLNKIFHVNWKFFLILTIFLLSFVLHQFALSEEYLNIAYYSYVNTNYGYGIAAKITELVDNQFKLEVNTVGLSIEHEMPIGYSLYDNFGHLIAFETILNVYNDLEVNFSTTFEYTSDIKDVILKPIYRKVGEDHAILIGPFYNYFQLYKITLPDKNSKLNLRKYPKSTGSVLSSFPNNTIVFVQDVINSWAFVHLETHEKDFFEGYMSLEYLTPILYEENGKPSKNTEFNENTFENIEQNIDDFDPSLNAEIRYFEANQEMSAGYKVSAYAKEQSDRPGWFNFQVKLSSNMDFINPEKISMFYLFVNNIFSGVLSSTANQSEIDWPTYTLNIQILEQVESLYLIPVYDGWDKGSEIIHLRPIRYSSTEDNFASTEDISSENKINNFPFLNSSDGHPGQDQSEHAKGRKFSVLQNMEGGYTLYATAIENIQHSNQFLIRSFISLNASGGWPDISLIYLYVNGEYLGTLEPLTNFDSFNKQTSIFELNVSISHNNIYSLALVPINSFGQTNKETIYLHPEK